jgi:ferrochelatase
MAEARVAVVGLQMGGPAHLAGVEAFLRELFADPALVRLPWPLRGFQARLARRIARRRAPEVAQHYAQIGGGSPILEETWAQMEGVAGRLRELGVDAFPLVSMRYCAPRSDEAARLVARGAATHVVALSLYPQYSPATAGSSLLDLRVALSRSDARDLPYYEVASYAGLEAYLEAVAAPVRRLLAGWGPPAPHIVFSAHGLPEAYVRKGDPYREEIETSYQGVRARLGPGLETSLAFQSRVGPGRWLGPGTEQRLRELAGSGVRRVLMVPLGFVSENVETLYEMDILYGDLARRLGIGFARAPVPGADPGFLGGLADLVLGAVVPPLRLRTGTLP